MDYKLSHMNDSEVVEKMKYYWNPWRYPFCDIFLYRYDKRRNRFVNRREKARLWWPNNFYEASIAHSNGTCLKKFGNFQMRVFSHSQAVLDRQMGTDWQFVGKLHNFNHYKMKEQKEVEFLLPGASISN